MSREPRSGGAIANEQGTKNKENIASALEHAGAIFIKDRMVKNGHLFCRKKRIDFYIKNHIGFPKGLILRTIWQGSRGSAEEKLPFEFECAKKYPCPVIFMLMGDGRTEGAITYAKSKVDGRKIIAVFDSGESECWLMKSKFI